MKIAAKDRLSINVYDFIDGGAGEEFGVSENKSSLNKLKVVSRVLRGIETTETKCDRIEVLTGNISPDTPFLIAPTAHHRLVDPRGESATLAAAQNCGIPYILSSMSDTPIESLGIMAGHPVLFQLYIFKDRELTRAIIRKAENAGCTAIVLTVDCPKMGNRVRGKSKAAQYVAEHFEGALSWKDIAWIREITHLPLVLKGILHPDDAKLAYEYGVDAIYLSNHGGRQLDHHVSAVTQLPKIRRVISDSLPILVDGGVRSGVDAFKILALGASAVAIGRPILWGLAVAGQTGVETVLKQLVEDFKLTMHLCGCKNLSEITEDLVLGGE